MESGRVRDRAVPEASARSVRCGAGDIVRTSRPAGKCSPVSMDWACLRFTARDLRVAGADPGHDESCREPGCQDHAGGCGEGVHARTHVRRRRLAGVCRKGHTGHARGHHLPQARDRCRRGVAVLLQIALRPSARAAGENRRRRGRPVADEVGSHGRPEEFAEPVAGVRTAEGAHVEDVGAADGLVVVAVVAVEAREHGPRVPHRDGAVREAPRRRVAEGLAHELRRLDLEVLGAEGVPGALKVDEEVASGVGGELYVTVAGGGALRLAGHGRRRRAARVAAVDCSAVEGVGRSGGNPTLVHATLEVKVAMVAPGGPPGVLELPVGHVGGGGAVAHEQHHVVGLLAARGAVEDARLVELQLHRVGLDAHGHGLLRHRVHERLLVVLGHGLEP
mmetsp:Transcript_14739/g.43245  ORF Transcript_14739/g.43245 Transcript_14739/m.43245 type:complete len:392 (-) Transcript_14739:999-2174(-)